MSIFIVNNISRNITANGMSVNESVFFRFAAKNNNDVLFIVEITCGDERTPDALIVRVGQPSGLDPVLLRQIQQGIGVGPGDHSLAAKTVGEVARRTHLDPFAAHDRAEQLLAERIFSYDQNVIS